MSKCQVTYHHVFSNFSKLEESQLSPAFYALYSLPWKILIMPRWYYGKKYLGVFLQCNNGDNKDETWSCYGEAELRLIPHCIQRKRNHTYTRRIKHLFCSLENDWGYSRFLPWEQVCDPKGGYIKDDTIIVEVFLEIRKPDGSVISSDSIWQSGITNTSLELKKLISGVAEILKCAICLDILNRDVIVCINGHIICKGCKGDQDICPTCRYQFSNVQKLPLIQQALEIMPCTCSHKNCNYIVNPGDDHESYCCWKITDCKVPHCEWEGAMSSLLDHVKNLHPTIQILQEKNVSLKRDFIPDKSGVEVCLISIFEHLMWKISDHDSNLGVLKETFHVVFNGKLIHELFVRLSFESMTCEHSTSIKLNTSYNVDFAKENVIMIPTPILRNFHCSKSNSLFFSLSVTKTRQ